MNKRQENKQKLVNYKGGKCQFCPYDTNIKALQFHHVDPSIKNFSIQARHNYNFNKLVNEVDKCLLLCANCHAEEHSMLDQLNVEEKQKRIDYLCKKYLTKSKKDVTIIITKGENNMAISEEREQLMTELAKLKITKEKINIYKESVRVKLMECQLEEKTNAVIKQSKLTDLIFNNGGVL